MWRNNIFLRQYRTTIVRQIRLLSFAKHADDVQSRQAVVVRCCLNVGKGYIFMEKKDAEILLNFLKDIMYSRRYQNLNVTILNPDAQDLGEGLNLLSKYILECKRYIDEVSSGNTSAKPVSEDNPFIKYIEVLVKGLDEKKAD